MKPLIILLLSLSVVPLTRCADDETDLVWSALQPVKVESVGQWIRTSSPLPSVRLGAQKVKKTDIPWPSFTESSLLKLKSKLIEDGWTVVSYPADIKGVDSGPASIVFDASKKDRRVLLAVSLLPIDSTTYYLTYTQGGS